MKNIESFEAGHFYSVIPNMDEIWDNEHRIEFAGEMPKHELFGVDLNINRQLELINIFVEKYYKDIPFDIEKKMD